MIQIFCGDGKGKTTAAMGEVIRFAGHGGAVLVFQYLKDNHSSERKSLAQLQRVTLMNGPDVMKFTRRMTLEEKEALKAYYGGRLLEIKAWLDEQMDCQTMVLLDEVLYAAGSGFVDEDEILSVISAYPQTEWLLTGRTEGGALYDAADYISKIVKIRHPYDKGITARAGIEY